MVDNRSGTELVRELGVSTKSNKDRLAVGRYGYPWVEATKQGQIVAGPLDAAVQRKECGATNVPCRRVPSHRRAEEVPRIRGMDCERWLDKRSIRQANLDSCLAAHSDGLRGGTSAERQQDGARCDCGNNPLTLDSAHANDPMTSFENVRARQHFLIMPQP